MIYMSCINDYENDWYMLPFKIRLWKITRVLKGGLTFLQSISLKPEKRKWDIHNPASKQSSSVGTETWNTIKLR